MSDGFRIGDFWSDQPERVNKRKAGKFLPLLTKIPELICIGVVLPESNRLVADDETSARQSCTLRITAGQPSGQSELRQKTAQQIRRRFGCRIKFDLLDVGERAAVRDYYAVNRAVR